MTTATKRARKRPNRSRYFELVQRFPLRPLRSDDELSEAIRMIDSLITRGDLDKARSQSADEVRQECTGCTADDILTTIKLIREKVFDRNQIHLESEVQIWP